MQYQQQHVHHHLRDSFSQFVAYLFTIPAAASTTTFCDKWSLCAPSIFIDAKSRAKRFYGLLYANMSALQIFPWACDMCGWNGVLINCSDFYRRRKAVRGNAWAKKNDVRHFYNHSEWGNCLCVCVHITSLNVQYVWMEIEYNVIWFDKIDSTIFTIVSLYTTKITMR